MTLKEEIDQIINLHLMIDKAQTYQEMVRYIINHREDLERYPTPRVLLNVLILQYMQEAEKYTSLATEKAKKLKDNITKENT